MSILATAETNTPSKVSYTEYIITENVPEGSQAGVPQHLGQLDVIRTRTIPHRRTSFMRTMIRIFHV